MHPLLLKEIVDLCKRRLAQGDHPVEPSAPVEQLEHAVIQLSSYVGALAAKPEMQSVHPAVPPSEQAQP